MALLGGGNGSEIDYEDDYNQSSHQESTLLGGSGGSRDSSTAAETKHLNGILGHLSSSSSQQQQQQQELDSTATNSTNLSPLMLATDDLEIPLIEAPHHHHHHHDNHHPLHHHHPHPHRHSNGGMATGAGAGRRGSGSGGGESNKNEFCLMGQKGFRPALSDYTSNKRAKQQLVVATVICFLFMIAELIGGLMAGSLAVVTDAAHLLTDCIGFVVAMVAISLAKKRPDRRMTFGYKRFEVLGAVVSVLGIWLLTGILVYMAIQRVIDQSFEIHADTMIIISTIGVGINIVMASVLHGNCLKVQLPHGHSHGPGGHGHSHSHNHPCKSSSSQLLSNGSARKDDTLLTHGVINMHSPSIHTTHSRHNSFSKTLPNGGNLLLDETALASAAFPADRSSFSRINLDSDRGSSPLHKNGSYTLLMSSNDDGLHLDSQMQQPLHSHHHGCDSAEEDCSANEHEDNEMDEDLKLGNAAADRNQSNLNIRAAMIHVIGDFIQSIGVLISAVVIKFYPNAKLIDPACTFAFSVIVFCTTFKIMRESLTVLLNAAPPTINVDQLRKEVRFVNGVVSVHHLTVFGVSVDWDVMSVHVVIDNITNGETVVRSVSRIAKRNYGIKHVTVQVERQSGKGALATLHPEHHHLNELI